MITNEDVKAILKRVYDPELGLNIVDLGLVYDIQVSENNDVYVKMTLTTPGCPLHGSITGGAEVALQAIPEINQVKVDLVWEPAWSPAMMTDEAKEQLGRK